MQAMYPSTTLVAVRAAQPAPVPGGAGALARRGRQRGLRHLRRRGPGPVLPAQGRTVARGARGAAGGGRLLQAGGLDRGPDLAHGPRRRRVGRGRGRKLGVEAVMVGTSQRNAIWHLLRGNVLKSLVATCRRRRGSGSVTDRRSGRVKDSESFEELDTAVWAHIEAERFGQAEIALRELIDLIAQDALRLHMFFGLLGGVLNRLDRADEGTEMYRRALIESRRPPAHRDRKVGAARYMLANQYLLYGDPALALAETRAGPAGQRTRPNVFSTPLRPRRSGSSDVTTMLGRPLGTESPLRRRMTDARNSPSNSGTSSTRVDLPLLTGERPRMGKGGGGGCAISSWRGRCGSEAVLLARFNDRPIASAW